MKIKFSAASLGVFLLAIIVFASLSDSFAMSRRPRLDSATKGCVKCHKMETGKHFGPSHTAHVVGMDYIDAAARSATLVSAGSLDPRLKLIDGRISCITCHTEYQEETHRESTKDRNNAMAVAYPLLRVDNNGSALCLKCHKRPGELYGMLKLLNKRQERYQGLSL